MRVLARRESFIRWFVLATCLINASYGTCQAGQHTATFEVASIKPVSPSSSDTPMTGMWEKMQDSLPVGFIPMSGASLVRIQHLSMASLVAAAFRIRRNEIVGPGWITTQSFDIDARVPADAPHNTINEMLQELLVERFGLKYHRAAKEQMGYALLVADGGPRLTSSARNSQLLPSSLKNDDVLSTVQKTDRLELMKMTKKLENADDHAAFTSFKLKDVTLSALAQKLSTYTDSPVIDMTRLDGRYDINMEFSFSKADREFDSPSGSLIQALKEKGLRLNRQRVSRPIFVIDQLSKDATAN